MARVSLGSRAPVRNCMRTQAHADILRLQEHLVAPGAPFAADPRGLGTAEWLPEGADILAVHETHAGLDGRGNAMCAPEILAPNVATQSVGDVIRLGDGVGLIGKGNQASDRSENLFLGDTHAIIHIGEYGGFDEIPFCQGSAESRSLDPAA